MISSATQVKIKKPLKVRSNHTNQFQIETTRDQFQNELNELNQKFCLNTIVEKSENKNNKMDSKTTEWLIDSGASINISGQKNILTNFRESSGKFVTISDGSKIEIKGFGTLKFKIQDKNQIFHTIIFDNVAYIPGISVNLISVKELISLNLTVTFSGNECQVFHKNGHFAIASLKNNVYSMEITHNTFEINFCIHDWHRKLGHRNIDHIKRIKTSLNLKVTPCKCNDQCLDCLKGKIAEPPFPKNSLKPSLPRKLITSDLCGPFQTQSLGGAKYFITFVDAATDYTEVFALRNKSDATEIIKSFMEKCKTQYNHYPSKYRTDRGGEFISSDLQNYLSSKGILFECTVPNTPQQNGISERKNRTLVEAIRTILAAKNLPHYLWGEALHYSNDTFNSIPKLSKTISPKEEFANKNCEFEFIEFGTPVVFNIIEQNRSKLLPKGAEGVFVGHDHNSKGYRIFHNGKILIRRNVKFLASFDHNKDKMSLKSEKILPEENIKSLRRSERIKNQQSHATLKTPYEPKTYKQAMKCEQRELWKDAMQSELNSINLHHTWEIVDLPKDRSAIGSKWVFKVKTDSEGKQLYKARLVAQGFTQIYGIDYDEVFAPVARPTSFRILLTLAGKENMKIKQFDVKTAFLNGQLEQEIYMKAPQGLQIEDKVLKLRKSLYGLKQAARIWNQAINHCLLQLNFIQSKYDSCLYINNSYDSPCYLIIHVDDMLIASRNENLITMLSTKISQTFELKSLGDVKQFIGISVQRTQNGTYAINQSDYIRKIAETFQLEHAKLSTYPMDVGYYKIESENFDDQDNHYRKIIGMLLYLSTNTRPDISAAVGILSQRLSKPRKLDLNESHRVVKYLLKTINHSLILGDSMFHLKHTLMQTGRRTGSIVSQQADLFVRSSVVLCPGRQENNESQQHLQQNQNIMHWLRQSRKLNG